MTRAASVAQIKQNRPVNGDGKPRVGTKIRATYDALRRGEAVKNCDCIDTLRNDYGMEFERLPHWGGMRLVGEWEGPYFVPLERMLQDDAA